MKWLIDNKYFDEPDKEEIISIIKSFGDEYYCGDRPQDTNNVGIALGSINFLCMWGGIDFDMTNYRCSKYYPSWLKYLLNDEHSFYPLSYLYTDIPYSVYNEHCCCGECEPIDNDKIFVRPDSGNKSFSGMVLNKQHKYTDILALSNASKNELVVVSPVKYIEKEYRFFVTDKILSCCQYCIDGSSSDKVPKSAINYVNKLLKDKTLYRPSEIGFVIDVAKLDYGGYAVIELNAIECSGFYCCSKYDILKGIKESYERLYKQT